MIELKSYLKIALYSAMFAVGLMLLISDFEPKMLFMVIGAIIGPYGWIKMIDESHSRTNYEPRIDNQKEEEK